MDIPWRTVKLIPLVCQLYHHGSSPSNDSFLVNHGRHPSTLRPPLFNSNRNSPVQSLSLPTLQNGFATNSRSRSSSPSPGLGPDDTISRSIYSLSPITRSRNSS